jgi:hypothetical protein
MQQEADTENHFSREQPFQPYIFVVCVAERLRSPLLKREDSGSTPEAGGLTCPPFPSCR